MSTSSPIPGSCQTAEGLLPPPSYPRKGSFRTECMIRDAVCSTLSSFGLSHWWIGQFFGWPYRDVARFCWQHRRRVARC